MALGAMTVAAGVGQEGGPISLELISFAGDGTYSAGGTTGFEALVRAAVGKGNLDVLAVIGQDCGGYVPVYLRATDALKVYEQTDTATSPLIETATANLSGTTFNVIVLCR